ncbi:MAG: hypothetical protein DWQ05_11665 [Calditrichaeota bacterium]|nr:MAG: hypothetical protein DWQ05_11665 [Calditrichota bacterium]
MQKKIITLTTDFGTQDGYAGVMHGVILKTAPHATIVDLTHEIPAQNIFAAAFLVESHSKYFPKSSIHVVVVDPGVGSSRRILLAESESQFFLAPDNGLLSFLNKRKNTRFYRASNRDYWLPELSQTFHGRDIFAPLAAFLANDLDLKMAFEEIIESDIEILHSGRPTIKDNRIQGKITYCDHFGNLITNIRSEDLPGDSTVTIEVGNHRIAGLAKSYSEKNSGEILAIINSFNHLEIAVNSGRADRVILNYKNEDVVVFWH